jgi:predicted benzoate:H+ symporter BenE
VTLWGVNSAFWGLVAGTLALFVENYRLRTDTRDAP